MHLRLPCSLPHPPFQRISWHLPPGFHDIRSQSLRASQDSLLLPPTFNPSPNLHEWTSKKSPNLAQVSMSPLLQWTPRCLLLFSLTYPHLLPSPQLQGSQVQGLHSSTPFSPFCCFWPGPCWQLCLSPHILTPDLYTQPLHGFVHFHVPNAYYSV